MDEDRVKLPDPFFAVFTVAEEDETFTGADFYDIFHSRGAADEAAEKAILDDGVSRVIVRCVPVALVEARPTIRELTSEGLPAGVKPPARPKGVIR